MNHPEPGGYEPTHTERAEAARLTRLAQLPPSEGGTNGRCKTCRRPVHRIGSHWYHVDASIDIRYHKAEPE